VFSVAQQRLYVFKVTECSHLLVFCARNDASPTIERFIKAAGVEAKAPDYATALRANFSSLTTEQFLAYATNQAFIALGVAVTAAADARIGACPMSGFIPQDVHRVLQLPANQWPVAYLAIGSQLDGQNSPQIMKFRLPTETLYTFHDTKI
jgi:nitroreductase / dihydropteridine reductase